MSQVQGKVEAKNRDNSGVKLGDTWYNTEYPETLAAVNRGDSILFDADGTDIVSQVAVVAKAQKKGGFKGKGGQRQKNPRDVYGPIVGHAFLVAATLRPGTEVADLVSTVKQILRAEEDLLNAKLASLDSAKPASAPAQAPTPAPQPPATSSTYVAPVATLPSAAVVQSAPAAAVVDDDKPW